MKFRFNLILVFTLIFILGAFCVSSCKKATEEPVEENYKPEAFIPTLPISELIYDDVARDTRFDDDTAKYSDEVRNGLITKIETDLSDLNNAFNNGNMGVIAQMLHRWRKPGETRPSPPGEIISYLQRLRNGDPNTGELPVEDFRFIFAGAVVVPVNIELNPFSDDETNFISLNTYIFTFRGSDPESIDPAGSGGGDREHKFNCSWE